MTKPLRLVRVIWEDASLVDDSGGPWHDRNALAHPEPTLFDQVGWLMELTVDHVLLCSAVGKELISSRDRIPMGMVRSIFEFGPDSGIPVTTPKRRRKTT